MAPRVALLGAVGFVSLAGVAGRLRVAEADPQAGGALAGPFREGPLREEYTVQQWLPGCGPAPVSSSQGGGGVVDVQHDGDELVLTGGGKTFRTNGCYDPLPTLARDAHTRDPTGRSWRTRCATPPSDPRRATMNTLVTATSDSHLEMAETGRYEITLTEGRCIADVKRTRTYDLVVAPAPQPAPAPTPEATAAPAPAPTAAPAPVARSRCEPGAPARLEVRPSRKLLRPGEAFAFRAVVSDAQGCVTATATAWSLAGAPAGVSVDPNGNVHVDPSAAEGEAALVATAAGRSVQVAVTVAAASHYDALLAGSGLNAAGESDDLKATDLPTGSIGSDETTAVDAAAHRRRLFLTIIFGLTTLVGVAAVFLLRRRGAVGGLSADAAGEFSRSSAGPAPLPPPAGSLRAEPMTVAPVGGAKVCPTCRREYEGAAAFCPHDATPLVPVTVTRGAAGGAPLPAGGSICPTCTRGFGPGVRVCPFDQEELIPYAMHVAARAPAAAAGGANTARGKICPTCGGRFDGAAGFCGKDGTALVLLN